MEGIEMHLHYIKGGSKPRELTAFDLKSYLTPLLNPFGIINFEIRIFKSGIGAALTTHKRANALKFQAHYQKSQFSPRLMLHGRRLKIQPRIHEPNEILVRVLKREEKALLSAGHANLGATKPRGSHLQRQFNITSVACGNWEYTGPQVYYHAYFNMPVEAVITFGDRFVVLDYPSPLNKQKCDTPKSHPGSNNCEEAASYRLRIPYSAITTYVLDRGRHPAFVYTLTEAPKVWVTDPTERFRTRTVGVKALPLQISTSCHSYRLELSIPSDADQLLRLERARVLPQCSLSSAVMHPVALPFTAQLSQLRVDLQQKGSGLSFGVKFQLQKLAQNGNLPPPVVSGVIKYVLSLQIECGTLLTVAALRRLFPQLPYAGPRVKYTDMDLRAVEELLGYDVAAVGEEQSYQKSANTSTTMVTYRAEVTPACTFLAGPDPESSNRVLRKYSAFSDHFLRVTFMDEDGEAFYFDRFRGNAAIFHERFIDVLRNGIEIAGRLYEFLGFSHSSLRAQTCWFLAPFMEKGNIVNADWIISKLGSFRHIRSAARCAARIGQAFTETPSSIPLDPNCVEVISDIERNGRVFSDGVGTCSLKVLKTLQATQKAVHVPATVFQIRYRGAKGVISLDSRLHGDVLRLRPSMIKFEGTEDTNIEICGIASQMLPLVLNRQLIKILEDLHVPNKVFQDLQNCAIEELRSGVSSVTNAAAFLEKNNVGITTHTTWLLRKMQSLGLALSDDMFFRDILDAVVLVQLQQLKFRTRLPVKEGATLYGIMDETDTLAEGEIYCSWIDKDGRPGHTVGPVLVTRSPALHPGDIQLAKAVTVPENSKLRDLHNCIAFSSKGERDLPSQLSGGDLDGDLYHIIWDANLIPKTVETPASYPRALPIDLGREITRQDIANFFIDFMEQDQLGIIATQHKILADQLKEGTLHPDCLKLAELHSTAVDFSKTGIPINEAELPWSCRNNIYKPDFMAPGRKVKIEERGISFVPEQLDFVEPDDPRRAGEPRPHRYYESTKILGILYRSIDESAFFTDLHNRSPILKDDSRMTKGVLSDLWEYVLGETTGIEWEDYVEDAWRMRDAYDATVYDIILQYSTSFPDPLEEIEVFIGQVICRHGYSSKRQREYMTGMKEKYDGEALKFMAAMRENDNDLTDENEHVALWRSMACLSVGIQEPRECKRKTEGGRRDTFAWLAAAAVMRELEALEHSRIVGSLEKGWGMFNKALRLK